MPAVRHSNMLCPRPARWALAVDRRLPVVADHHHRGARDEGTSTRLRRLRGLVPAARNSFARRGSRPRARRADDVRRLQDVQLQRSVGASRSRRRLGSPAARLELPQREKTPDVFPSWPRRPGLRAEWVLRGARDALAAPRGDANHPEARLLDLLRELVHRDVHARTSTCPLALRVARWYTTDAEVTVLPVPAGPDQAQGARGTARTLRWLSFRARFGASSRSGRDASRYVGGSPRRGRGGDGTYRSRRPQREAAAPIRPVDAVDFQRKSAERVVDVRGRVAAWLLSSTPTSSFAVNFTTWPTADHATTRCSLAAAPSTMQLVADD